MTDCRSHGLGDCPQHATSGIGLLRRQYDEMVSENARLQALLAERDAEIARLVERVAELEAVVRDVVTAWDSGTDMSLPAAVDKCDAALAARGGEVQG